MDRIELAARLREIIEIAQSDTVEAIRQLCEVLEDLNDEIEEIRR